MGGDCEDEAAVRRGEEASQQPAAGAGHHRGPDDPWADRVRQGQVGFITQGTGQTESDKDR